MNVKVFLAKTLFVVALCLGSGSAYAVVVGESGDTSGSAFSLDAFFTLNPDANIFNSTTIPHATATGSLDDPTDIDFFSFTGLAGATVDLDIDFGSTGVPIDSVLSLFNSVGFLIAVGDDAVPVDPGSTSGLDSFLGTFVLPATDTYFVAISEFNNFPDFSGCSVSAILVSPGGASGGAAVSGWVRGGFCISTTNQSVGRRLSVERQLE